MCGTKQPSIKLSRVHTTVLETHNHCHRVLYNLRDGWKDCLSPLWRAQSNYGTLIKAYCVSYRVGTKQWLDYLCQSTASLVKTLQLMPARKLFATGRYLIRAGKSETELRAGLVHHIYAQHLAFVGLIISSNEMLISALILHAWAARRVWNRTLWQN